MNDLPVATLNAATRLWAKHPQRVSEVALTPQLFPLSLQVPQNPPTPCWGLGQLGCTPSTPPARAAGTLLRGRELGTSPATLGVPPLGCPEGLLWLQAPQEIGVPASSPSSSPLALSLAKESHLGWWHALVFTLKCSHLPPGNVGHICTFSRTQRVVWSPSPWGFPAVLCSAPQSSAAGGLPTVPGDM